MNYFLKIAKRHKLIPIHGSKWRKLVLLIKNIIYIIYQLLTTQVSYYKLKVHKYISKIDKPIIHYYAICWNEAQILPFVLQHYKNIVDHFYFYDNYSNDETDQIINTYPNATIIKYDTGGTINDIIYQQIKNSAWKKSRGKADWVIVSDIDELLYCPNVLQLLKDPNNKTTIYNSVGIDMISAQFPEYGKLITETIKTGVPNSWLNKSILFDPHKIIEINYSPGAHTCTPIGFVQMNTNIIKLLHYKYMGLEYVMQRIYQYRSRLSKENLELEYGSHYLEEDKDIISKFNNLAKSATQVI